MIKKIVIGFVICSLMSAMIRAAEQTSGFQDQNVQRIQAFRIEQQDDVIENIYRITEKGEEQLQKEDVARAHLVKMKSDEFENGEIKIGSEDKHKGKLLLHGVENNSELGQKIATDFKNVAFKKSLKECIERGDCIAIVYDLAPNTGHVRFFSQKIPDLDQKLKAFQEKLNTKLLLTSQRTKQLAVSKKVFILGIFAGVFVALSAWGTFLYCFKSPDTPLPYVLQMPAIMVMKIIPAPILSAIKGRFGTRSNVYSGS